MDNFYNYLDRFNGETNSPFPRFSLLFIVRIRFLPVASIIIFAAFLGLRSILGRSPTI